MLNVVAEPAPPSRSSLLKKQVMGGAQPAVLEGGMCIFLGCLGMIWHAKLCLCGPQSIHSGSMEPCYVGDYAPKEGVVLDVLAPGVVLAFCLL